MSRLSSTTFTPHEAWRYAASWASYVRPGDPGACLYGFSEGFCVQSEAHRRDCLRYIRLCRSAVRRDHRWYWDGGKSELAKLYRLALTVIAAPVLRRAQ
ncbi:hypothetical protein [Labrys wisconsinensis]|uniref:Uncharacterized protein n=1 Tax=Labrys wisconsinensis TaxID=425677 RepID=A0ABU0JLU7_9HYPH|nr:hypothetical protein [Labrys wisconsinensis]MDQ0475254.1 hypothetical protein [Labrys wisconsinensis]